MKKKNIIFLVLLTLVFLLLFASPIKAASLKVNSSIEEMHINGVPTYSELVKINNTNYLELRNSAQAFKNTLSSFDVNWNDKTKTAEIIRSKQPSSELEFRHLYSELAVENKLNLLIDGEIKTLSTYLIGGRNYLKLRDIAEIIDGQIDWNSKDRRIEIETGYPEGIEKLEIDGEIRNANDMPKYSERYGIKNNTFMIDNKDGTYGVLQEDIKGKLILDIYDIKDNKKVASKEIKKDLDLFGGFYSGDEYNYIVFGQENLKEDRNKEVIRIVKYDKKFNEIDKLSILGGESIVQFPFRSGNCNMSEKDDTLIVHTSRIRFKTDDGLNHQSQLTMVIDSKNMKLKENIEDFQANHVSHSFDQYVKFDGNNIIYLDHGDAYPRSIVLHKNNIPQDLFIIPGESGMNATGVSLGGLEVMDKGYLVAFNSVDHSKVKEYTHYSTEGVNPGQRDIVLIYSGKDNSTGLNGRSFEEKIIKKYVGSNKKSSIPKMIKFDKNRVIILLEEHTLEDVYIGLRYIEVDVENGIKVVKEGELPNYKLSTSQPIIIDGNLVWTINGGYNENYNRLLHKIDLSAI